MRILVVGAGAVGGYFGGRLLEAGRDVTFLVRPGRAAQLAADGLRISSACGDAHLPAPPCVLADDIAKAGPFDAVLLSCKAYDLDAAVDSFAPAVGPGTAVLPVLNGMRHLDVLDARFGAARVLCGQCAISAALAPTGTVRHLNETHAIGFGERDGTRSQRVAALEEAMAGANFHARASDTALLDMWEKWVFLATLAAGTCLMRATVGDIVAAGGDGLMRALLAECRSIAEAAGQAPRPKFMQRSEAMLTQPGSAFAASMLRDLERGAATEADHVLGDLLRRGGDAEAPSLLRAAFVHLKVAEARQARDG